jgi:lipoprotein-anchoring transpeptidase ErfK/SrfK
LTDYYSILSRAVASLEPNTAQARAQLFRRARQLLLERMQDSGSRWTEADAEAELASFEAATDRIESDIARRAADAPVGRPRQRASAEPAAPTHRSMGRVAVLSAVGLVGVLLIGLAVYAFRGGEVTTSKPGVKTTVTAKQDAGAKPAPRTDVDGDDLEPGVDGGSTDTGLPYFLRRQAVYYRTVYTAGMIVVDRSQRFIYLVQPQSRAIRYGIGVGGECNVSAGLYRIQSKSAWPEWSPSPALLKRRAYPARVPGGPGNPLGAYVMYLENNSPGIHGTNSPKSIGQAPTIGCFRLVNDDVVDLEKRVPVGTGIVVLN